MHRLRRGSPCAVALLVLAVAGCGGGGEGAEQTTSTSARSSAPSAQAGGTPGTADDSVELYFTSGEQFEKVERPLPEAGSAVEAAARILIQGPPSDQPPRVETQIPPDTAVEDVELTADGTATVEVSEDFLEGIPPRPAQRDAEQEAELNARLGQVTYTLTQFDRIEEAKVVAGGIAVEPASDREDFQPPERGPQRLDRTRGEKSPSTRRIQEQLARLRFLPERAVDGVPGYRTQQAVIAFQAWHGLARDGIVGPATTAALAEAKPPRPRGSGPDRRIEVYRDKGVALLVAHGRTRRAIHVSSGAAATPTPAGTFEVFRKELRSWSVPFGVWLPYASYFNQGIAFHEYADVPPYPASHGCVRVPAPEAKGVYRFAKIGTTVVVL